MVGTKIAALLVLLIGLLTGQAAQVQENQPSKGIFAPMNASAAPIGADLNMLWGTWVSTQDPAVTITFTPNQTGVMVRPHSGCNMINGSGTVTDSRLILGPLTMTKMFCQDAQDLEGDLLALVGSSPELKKDSSGTLYLVGEGGSAPFTKKTD